ncbi:MAG TPA: hypothetical protein VGD56_17915, partial [Gemmatirosa sp.]
MVAPAAPLAPPEPRGAEPRIRRRGRTLARLVGVLLAFALVFPPLFVAVGPDTTSEPVTLAAPDPHAMYTVYVTDWAYHTSVTIPQAPAWRLGPAGAEGAPYLDYSWGDRAY